MRAACASVSIAFKQMRKRPSADRLQVQGLLVSLKKRSLARNEMRKRAHHKTRASWIKPTNAANQSSLSQNYLKLPVRSSRPFPRRRRPRGIFLPKILVQNGGNIIVERAIVKH